MLYNLASSPVETTNLAASHAALVERLKAMTATWNKELTTPQWPSKVQAYETYDDTLLHFYD
jgi:hypothetical protein